MGPAVLWLSIITEHKRIILIIRQTRNRAWNHEHCWNEAENITQNIYEIPTVGLRNDCF